MSEPICDEAAERAVLGCVLLSPQALAEVAPQLTAEDFWSPQHATIWKAIAALWDAGTPVEPEIVARALDRRGELAAVGGAPHLHTLISADHLPTTANARYHAAAVVEASALRRIVQAGVRITQLGESRAFAEYPAEVLDAIRREVEEATSGRGTTAALPVSEAVGPYLDSLQQPLGGVVPTPWPDLNRLLHGGLHRKDLTLLAARTSVGKSLIALNMVRSAVRNGVPTDYLTSSEMSREEVMARLISNEASVPWTHLAKHELTTEDWDRVKRASDRIAEWPLRIHEDLDGMTPAAIRAHCRQSVRDGMGLLVLDQLSAIEPPDAKAPDHKQLDQITLRLRQLAGEFDIPVLLLHQLNRGATGKRPNMDTDLRSSDAPTHHAHKVILLWRQDETVSEIAAIVAKHRGGPKGEVTLSFEGRYARAVTADPYQAR